MSSEKERQESEKKRVGRLVKRVFRSGALRPVDLEDRRAFLRKQQAEMLREVSIDEEE